jgi:hypothetical protein
MQKCDNSLTRLWKVLCHTAFKAEQSDRRKHHALPTDIGCAIGAVAFTGIGSLNCFVAAARSLLSATDAPGAADVGAAASCAARCASGARPPAGSPAAFAVRTAAAATIAAEAAALVADERAASPVGVPLAGDAAAGNGTVAKRYGCALLGIGRPKGGTPACGTKYGYGAIATRGGGAPDTGVPEVDAEGGRMGMGKNGFVMPANGRLAAAATA